jgi:hypothetical protein
MTDEKAQLTWHTVWTLLGIFTGFIAIGIQIANQYGEFYKENESFHQEIQDRVTRIEVKLEQVQKHMDNVQYQLDHERAVR